MTPVTTRRYHVVVVREKDGATTYLTATPEDHRGACEILRKCRRDRAGYRYQLSEAS